MKMSLIYMMIFITGLWSCDKGMPPVIDPPEEEQKMFDLQWATRLDMVKEIVGTDFTQQYGDWVLIGGDIDAPPTVKAYNKITGDLDWEYNHHGSIDDEIDIAVVLDNYYVALCTSGIIVLDLNSQNYIWELDFRPLNMYRSSFIGVGSNKFYTNISIGPVGNDVNHVMEFDLLSGTYRSLYETEDYMSPPVFLDNSFDEFIVNTYPDNSLPPQETMQGIRKINAQTGEVIWDKENVTDFFSSNVLHPPILYDDLVITGGDWSIYAFDVHTGEQRWRYEFDYPWAIWNNTNHLIYGDRLYVNNGQHDVTCLDPRTGELIWNNPEGGANCTDNMLYYEKEDYLVFASWGYGSVMVLNAITGETVHREHRYDDSQYNNDVVYDEELDMFFTSTYKHAVGFKINGE